MLSVILVTVHDGSERTGYRARREDRDECRGRPRAAASCPNRLEDFQGVSEAIGHDGPPMRKPIRRSSSRTDLR